jgi:hypothetical protein
VREGKNCPFYTVFKTVLSNNINNMEDKTIREILAGDVFDENFGLAFYALLEKFVNEYDDMSNMEAIKQAQKLLDIFNE